MTLQQLGHYQTRNKRETKKHNRKKIDKQTKDFSWIETIKEVVNIITKVISNMNSEKSIIEVISEAIKETMPLLKNLIKYLNQ